VEAQESHEAGEGAGVNRSTDSQKNRGVAAGTSWQSQSESESNTWHDQPARKDWAGWSALRTLCARRKENEERGLMGTPFRYLHLPSVRMESSFVMKAWRWQII